MAKPRVLLIGWDAADWKLIKPLVDAGEAPSIGRMINAGTMGNLATLQPILSPMLWNSIATGKRPFKHGILGFTEVNPHTGVISPVLSTSRKVKALWNILSQEGYRAHVVNWFASHPAEKINGVCVTDFYARIPKDWEAPWQMPADAIHPAEAVETLKSLRMHPKELEAEILQLFCPLAHEIDQTEDRRIQMLANLIAEALSIHAVTTHILEHEDWDFLAVYYGAIDHFCHGFMQYHPPKMAEVTDDDFRRFKDVVPNAYRFHDRMLARLLQLAGEDTTVIVCSDHGFHSDRLRPIGTPAIPAGPAYWHRDQGIIMMQGPNIAQDELIHGASLLDITPTVLQVFGLPIGRDMDGKPLLGALRQVQQIDTIESWETRAGTHAGGMHSGSAEMTREEADAIIQQFVALGYIDPPDRDADKAAAQTDRENRWNLARSYLHAGAIELAIPVLERLVDEMPDRRDFTLTLANCLQYCGFLEEAEQLIGAALPDDPRNEAVLHTLAEVALAKGDVLGALERLDQLAALDDAARASGGAFTTGRYLTLGATYSKLRRWEQALENYRKALAVDPELPRAHLGIAHCLLRLRRYDDAVEAALTAVELEHQLGPAHFALAMALIRSGRVVRSIDAAHMALKYLPNHDRAHRVLAHAYETIGQHERHAEFHRMQARVIRQRRDDCRTEIEARKKEIRDRVRERIPRLKEFYRSLRQKEAVEAQAAEKPAGAPPDTQPIKAREEPFVIVSGLPRSGTSLMMQMLQAGGMQVMTDGERQADEDNPEGYLEWEAIKKLKTQPELMEQARGKVTKVISMLLPNLPRQYKYKLVFVLRPIEEIVASQKKMIARRGTKGAELDPEQLTKSLTRHREEILKLIQNLGMDMLPVRYHRILEDPDKVVERLVRFVGADRLPNAIAMSSAVRQDLYRNRAPKQDEAEASPTG
jgi:predicted AlkP superfamily phosphohydrolase/phosphomutase/tetratricopeptide (TPR) repeat protein